MFVTRSKLKEHSESSRDLSVVLLLFGLALSLRLWQLGTQSIWVDEGATVDFAIAPASLFWSQLLLIEPNPPGYYAFMRHWVSAFGISDCAIRIPSAFAGSIAIIPLYFFARRHWGRGTAVIACLLFALTAVQIQYAQEARAYAFITFFFLTGLAAADSIARCLSQSMPMGRSLIVFILSVAGLAYAHFTGLFVIAALCIYQLVVLATNGKISRYSTLGLLKQAALIIIVVVPVLAIALYQLSLPSSGVDWISRRGVSDSIRVFIGAWSVGRLPVPFQQFPSIFLVGLVFAGVLRAWNERNAPTLGLAAVLLFTVISFYSMNFIQPILSTKVLIFGAPAALVIMIYGSGLISIRYGAYTMGAVLLVLTAYDTSAFLRTNSSQTGKEPWREMVQAVAGRYEPGTAIVHIGGGSEMHFLGGGPVMILKYWPGPVPSNQFFASDGGSPLDQFMIESHQVVQQVWPEAVCPTLGEFQKLEILSRHDKVQTLVQLRQTLKSQGARLLEIHQFNRLVSERWTAPECRGWNVSTSEMHSF